MNTPRRKRTLRLRTRVMFFFSLTALTASLGLAVVTFATARSFMIDQRQQTARTEAFANAKTVRDQLLTELRFDVATLRTESGGFTVLLLHNRPYAADARYSMASFPIELSTLVSQGGSGQQRYEYQGEPYVAVGINIAAADAQYFEAFPMGSTESNLRAIATALLVGAGVTILFAGFAGAWTSRRLLRPLSRVATAAGEIASGGLDVRMPSENDPDLDRLASSFNEMADAVQTRIEREARFASDVSHELRSPITALTAAVEVLDGRREDLPERSRQALDLVVSQVRRFDHMVMDLLELSRIDAGSSELNREEINPRELIPRIAQRYGFGEVPIDISAKVPTLVRLDKLRFERILANLLENAREHGGSPVRVFAELRGRTTMVLGVEDAGPGVARGERSRIFERFARGSAARHRVGTGLGLALVAEHAQAHGGEAWVEDRPGGGARFMVSFQEVT
ncbi:MAG: HAMP domain-containing protein [Actinobacteria bacterium]|uniref:histidine kinase n=2 Tax=freshwater metagenome TaxID=449393 RepID=A0A6J6A4G6_9ZZZZ|nr:HAMP domain-containing protein [Actinomycetota bacterium]MSX56910.1 HAMP domain-containing protein [Actinomycetota bacterium]MSZ82264.1 HAMP domain-containing protein [Actinomycetota bacterium]MTB16557.1 HAMP domain-containing protein [Actinomycetota bacterium]